MIVYILFEVLHGVLYPETHNNQIKKKKKGRGVIENVPSSMWGWTGKAMRTLLFCDNGG